VGGVSEHGRSRGRNKHHLYSTSESSSAWPRFGQIDFSASAGAGRHYSVASPEWADKPSGFANFLRSARFANSIYNGRLLAKDASGEGSFRYLTYRVRLSRRTEGGMYDMKQRAATCSRKSGPELVPDGAVCRSLLDRQSLRVGVLGNLKPSKP
jgi:hypothetical protein